ncbi:remodeling and spacing factor 1-like isoform X5 [Branchiostoma lanceolatum]|uniref:remodeling and spacing factor 1-like isoform X5 n=1 Tax=Branchiostoma lanceolatum TaxID=7740 RepID=UPI0034570E5D
MSVPEKGVDTDPDYAVVCGFLRRYGEALGLPPMSYAELQRALEDTTRLNPDLIMMQIKLMRKIGKSVSSDKWERYLVKMCRQFSQIAAWEMEQGGYQEVDPNIKLKLLKYLCERQFDDNLKFRAEVVNKEEADAMREKPLGRDKNGLLYWYMQDAETNLHLYREEPDDQYNSTWQVVCRTRDELEGLIAELEGGGKDTPDLEEEEDKSSSADQASLAGKIKDKCTNDEDKENKEEAQTDANPRKENQTKEDKEDVKTATGDKMKKESQTKEDKTDVKTATDDKMKKESQTKEDKKDVKTATDEKPSKEETDKPITSQHVSVIVKREITPEPVEKREPVKSSTEEDDSTTKNEDEFTKNESVTVKPELESGASANSATSSNQSDANEDKGGTSKGGDKGQDQSPPKSVSHVHKGIHSIENILRDVPIKCERDAITEPPCVVSASMDPTVGLQTFANGRIHYCVGEGSSMEGVQVQGETGSNDGEKERRSPKEGGGTDKEDDKSPESKEMSETAAVKEAKNKVREILSKKTLNNSSSNTDSAGGRTANDTEGQRSEGDDTGNKIPDSGKEMKTTSEREQVSTNPVSDDTQDRSERKKTEESRSKIEPEESEVKEKEKEKGEEKAESSGEVKTTSESENSGKECKETEKETEPAEEDVTKYDKRSPQPGKESEKPDDKEVEDPGNKTVDSCTSKDNTEKESKEPDKSTENTGKESKKPEKSTENTGKESKEPDKSTENTEKESKKPEKSTENTEKESKEPDVTTENTEKESKESDTTTEDAGKKGDHPEKATEDDQKEETTEKDNLETPEKTTKPQRGRKRGRRGRKSFKEAPKKPVKERDEDLDAKEEEGEDLDDSRSVSKDSESSKDAVNAPIRRSTRARKAVTQVYTPEVKKKPVTYPKEPSEPSLPPSPKPVKKAREKRGSGKRRGRRRKESSNEEESSAEEEEEDSSEEEEEEDSEYPTEDDSPCSKCGMYNHPEWILLCDKCDSGYHTACLRPPLMMIPDGDWFCPSCEHVQLVSKLREALADVDQELKKKKRAERRKERLTYVGISLENVIPEPNPESEMLVDDYEERSRPRHGHQHKKKKKQHHHHHRHRHHYDDDDKPVKTIAERRTSRRTRKDISYRFDDFDEVINEAIQEDVKASEGAGGYGGKDIENIIAAESGVVKSEGPKKGRRRRLMDLDADSEEEVGSEEEYNMSEGSEQSEVEEEPSEPSEASLSESDDSLAQRTRRRFRGRRSSKATRRSSRLRSGRKRRYWDSEEEEEDIDDEHSSVSSENIPRWSGVRTYSARRQKVCYKESSSSDEEQEKTKRSDLPDLEWEPEITKEEGSPRRKRPRLETSSESESSSDETREEPRKPARRQLDTSESDEEEEEEEKEEGKEEDKDEQETKDQDEEEDSSKKELSENASEENDNKDDTSTEGNKMGVSFQLPKVSKSMENSPTTDTLPLPAQMTQNGTHDSSGRSSRQSGEDEDELLANVMDLVAYVTEDD